MFRRRAFAAPFVLGGLGLTLYDHYRINSARKAELKRRDQERRQEMAKARDYYARRKERKDRFKKLRSRVVDHNIPAKFRSNGGSSAPRATNSSVAYAGKYSRPTTVYRKKRAGRRQKRARRQQRRWRHSLFRELAAQDLVVTGNDSLSLAAGKTRLVFGLALNHGDDIEQILSKCVGASTWLSRKVYVTKSRMDVTLFANQNPPQYCDVYEVVARKDLGVDEGNGFPAYFTFEHLQFLHGSELPKSDYMGVTPFHSHHFCESFVIKKTQRILLEGNSPITISLKGKRGRVDASDWNLKYHEAGQLPLPSAPGAKYFARAGWTAGWLFIVQGMPQSALTTAPMNSMRVDFNYVKMWTVKVLENNRRTLFYDHKNLDQPVPGYIVNTEGQTVQNL